MWQMVWFGRLSAISQLASRVGEVGGVRQICLHSATQLYTTWPPGGESSEGVAFSTLAYNSVLPGCDDARETFVHTYTTCICIFGEWCLSQLCGVSV
jgi:hypothetical protein